MIREGSIRQLTTDHTWVQEAIEHGVLAPDEARKHPNAHVIRRYLGSRQGVTPDTRLRLHADDSDVHAEANQGAHLLPGDIIVLCSDGLTDLVDNDEILVALRTRNTLGALEDLVKLSNRRGGHDNVTIITLAVPALERPTIPVAVRRTQRRLNRTLVFAAALGLLLLTLAGAATWNFVRPVLETTPSAIPSQPSQATLFPELVTQPPSIGTPAAMPTGAGEAAPQVTASPEVLPTSLLATLTPWPTNTASP
jgi:protein phosphatase